jgi:hypothetical protein
MMQVFGFFMVILALLIWTWGFNHGLLKVESLSRVDEGRSKLLDIINDLAWRIGGFMGIDFPGYEERNIPELRRYPEVAPHENVFLHPAYKRVAPIIVVVESEDAKEQVLRAFEYLHDQDIDTDYVAVNELVHIYSTPYDVVVDEHLCAAHVAAMKLQGRGN